MGLVGYLSALVFVDQILTKYGHIDLHAVFHSIAEFNFVRDVFYPVEKCEVDGFCNVEP